MAVLVILVLGVLWAAVLLPPILRARSQGPSSGIGEWAAGLAALGRRNGHREPSPFAAPLPPIMPPVSPADTLRVPGSMTPLQRRRRDVLCIMLGVCGLTFLMAVAGGAVALWVMHLLADVALGGYVYLLLQVKARAAGQRAKVRELRRPAPRRVPAMSRPEPAFADSVVVPLRRTASW